MTKLRFRHFFSTAMMLLQSSRLLAAPDFGPNVFIFEPGQEGMQERILTIFKEQESAQFSSQRYAFLFKPGEYSLDVPVGFYTHVAGLGQTPEEVAIKGAVRASAAWMNYNATCNFWRTAENFTVIPASSDHTNVWSVSQAAPLRRVHIKGDLRLSERGWSSGGFLADCQIDGTVHSGSQQQWFSRNSEWKSWNGGLWNMVFVGTTKAPAGDKAPFTVIETTPVIREKPYLYIDDAGQYRMMVPPLMKDGSTGTSWGKGQNPGSRIPLEHFYLAKPDTDTSATLNKALQDGKNLLFTPGIYHLEDSLVVSRPGTVVFGLGLPTLIPVTGRPAMVVEQGENVVICGLMFDASAAPCDVLLRVGVAGRKAGKEDAPTVLHDIFCRAGGAIEGSADRLVELHDDFVVGDHLWLWRADHGKGVGWEKNKNTTGLLVEGDAVTLYGLAVEHSQGYQTIWNGNRGRLYFYQSELPYDPPSQEAWMSGERMGFASYKVGDKVTEHEAWGLGVYAVFKNPGILLDRAIETPSGSGIQMRRMITVNIRRSSQGSGILHVLNDQGAPAVEKMQSRLD